MELAAALPIIFTIIALEALLSADNAMVLAVIVRPLPAHQRTQAMLYGLIGALILRALAIAFAVYLIQLWWVEVLGGIYLLYLTANHFLKRGTASEEQTTAQPQTTRFWPIVAQLNLVNLAFSIDSILVVVAVTQNYWLIVIGAFIGMALIWLAAGWLVGMIERYPALESVAYLLVGWAGLKLMLEGWSEYADNIAKHHEWAVHLDQVFFLSITGIIFVLGAIYAIRQGRRT